MRASFAGLCLVCTVLPAAAEDHDLLYFSAAPDYLGAGWMHARRSLDRSGTVFAVEVGSSMQGTPRAALAAGWRLVEGRLVATFMAGLEAGMAVGEAGVVMRPLAAVDLWWDAADWMASTRVKATPDYTDWRVAAGFRPAQGYPWFGPELSSHGGPMRIGFHATGFNLPGGAQARLSAGYCDDGVFGELSLWRRF